MLCKEILPKIRIFERGKRKLRFSKVEALTSSSPVETTSSSPIETTSIAPVQTTTSSSPVETTSIAPVQTTTSSSPVETTSIAPVQTTTSLISDIIDELFGPGGLDQYIDHMENADEGIEINTIDELKLDLEPFDFELETADF